MTKPRILLVEDEEHIKDALKLNLEMENYKVTAVGDGVSALKKFKEESYNLVVLDIMIPHLDGLAVCENIRLQNSEVPILFLSAKNTSEDRVKGLKKGGDDYLVKPFNLEELLLRVEKLINRNLRNGFKSNVGNNYTFGSNSVNFDSYEAVGANGTIHLSKKEAMLLKLLLDHKNEVVSREHILHTVWGYEIYPTTRTIDNFILSFRKYFETDPKNPHHFHSIRGVGYKFTE
jgi:two-component system alkaline phosphatase synthesis response regulator PhoP